MGMRRLQSRTAPPIHASESSVVLRARDVGAVDDFLAIRRKLGYDGDDGTEPDIDDYSHMCGSMYGIRKGTIDMKRFLEFCKKMGIREKRAKEQLEALLKLERQAQQEKDEDSGDSDGRNGSSSSSSSMAFSRGLSRGSSDLTEAEAKEQGVKKAVFERFCALHGIDGGGARAVAIKFMRDQRSFNLEKDCRAALSEIDRSISVAPVLNDFILGVGAEEVDVAKSRRGSTDTRRSTVGQKHSHHDCSTEGLPVHEGSPLDTSVYRYGIVMPESHCDLNEELFSKERMCPSEASECASEVGKALRALHEQGIIHTDIQLKNVLRLGDGVAIADFDSAHFLRTLKDKNVIGGSSAKLCPSLLPPEFIAKIDNWTEGCSEKERYEEYWKDVIADARIAGFLNPQDRQTISQCIQVLTSESKRNATTKSKGKTSTQSDWKDTLSSKLGSLAFEDLPVILSTCLSLEKFSAVWHRMLSNYALWDRIKPRVDVHEQCAYVFKAYDDTDPDEDLSDRSSTLPYELIVPSEKIDVWGFGSFLYTLCSGGSLFHTGYRGDLRDVDVYSRLHSWDRSAAKLSVRENVHDPLAQDILCRMLVPENERIPDMEQVLNHPFFSPNSDEAARLLERHAELQHLREETASCRCVTKHTRQLLDHSMEKYCKIGFLADEISVPTCLVVLPFDLKWSDSANRSVLASSYPAFVSTAEQIGHHLLEINKATARLSFWLVMNRRMRGDDGTEFKDRMKEWLTRARTESCREIAVEIVNALKLDLNYVSLCEEILAVDGTISKAKTFMRNPMGAARKAIRENSDSLVNCYSAHYVYLVDEISMVPSCKTVQYEKKMVYPMRVDMNPTLFKNLFLPFMNITVMKALAIGKLEGLAHLVGLPPSVDLPASWKGSEPSLLHRVENTSSIEEFVSLQTILRKGLSAASQGDVSSARSGSISSSYVSSLISKTLTHFSISDSVDMELSATEAANLKAPLGQLELFFREYDPMRAFGKLKRAVCGEKESSTGVWTSEDQIVRLKDEVEKEAKLELEKKKKTDEEFKLLLSEWQAMKKEAYDKKTDEEFKALLSEWQVMKKEAFDKSSDKSSEKSSDKSSEKSLNSSQNHTKYHFAQFGEASLTEDEFSKLKDIREECDKETKADADVGSGEDAIIDHTETIQAHRMGYANPNAVAKKKESDEERTKDSKSRCRRFRPWFGIC